MKLRKFFVFIFKKNLLTTIFTLFLVFLVVFSNTNLFAARNGLTLWAKNVVPSLFPFFIATELLNYTNLPYYLGKLTNKFMRPLFNVPGEGSYAFIMGIISGYPVGAKIINKFIDEGTCSKQEAERMLAFTNNSGPLFIIGTVGISLFGDSTIGIILFVTHILACLTVGMIFGFFSRKDSKCSNSKSSNFRINKCQSHCRNINIQNRTQKGKHGWKRFYRGYRDTFNNTSYNISDLGSILSVSITNAISTILLIGGFIVLFSIIISILNSLNIIDSISNILSYINIPSEFGQCILTGLLELTNGLNSVSCIHTKYMSIQIIISAFLLGFAGLSIFLQIFSIASKNNLSMKPYLIGKLLQGFIAGFYTFIILNNFDFLYFDITSL